MTNIPCLGHGEFEPCLEVGAKIAREKSGEWVLHASTGAEGDVLCGVQGSNVLQEDLVSKVVTHLAGFSDRAEFCFLIDKCRNFTKGELSHTRILVRSDEPRMGEVILFIIFFLDH